MRDVVRMVLKKAKRITWINVASIHADQNHTKMTERLNDMPEHTY